MKRAWMNVSLVLSFLIFGSGMANALVDYISTEDLIREADAIVLAEVKETVFLEKYNIWMYEKNLLKVEKVLKGILPSSNELTVVSRRLDPKDAMEDPLVVFPGKGTRILVFLKKSAKGEWVLSNLREGIWVCRGEGFSSPFRPSVERLTDLINSLEPPQKK